MIEKLSLSSIFLVVADIPDYGFPRCYTTFPNYDTNWVKSDAHEEVRPIVGVKRAAYTGSTEAHCSGPDSGREPPLIGLGPHWSPIGLTVYKGGGKNTLPSIFENALIVASHGSWNRDPWIGYRVHSYTIYISGKTYAISGQRTLLPPLRHSSNANRLRPVDIRNSPIGDGGLLMTVDRDDFFGNTSGGLYRIVGATLSSSPTGVTRINPKSSYFDKTSDWPSNVYLDKITEIPCARQLTHSTQNPRLVYVSTFAAFCPIKIGTGDAVYVLELAAHDSVVTRGPKKVISNLNGPQGIDYYNNKLYIATNGDSTANRGNCVLEFGQIDEKAEIMLSNSGTAINGTAAVSGTDGFREISCSFTRTQGQHYWRSLRVNPDGEFAIVSIGADCNWSQACTDTSTTNDYQTTLVKIMLSDGTRTVAARGIRNAIGLYFDENSNLLFTHFGSDMAKGISGASSWNNIPECTVELLQMESSGGLSSPTASGSSPSTTTSSTSKAPTFVGVLTSSPTTTFAPSATSSITSTTTTVSSTEKGTVTTEDAALGQTNSNDSERNGQGSNSKRTSFMFFWTTEFDLLSVAFLVMFLIFH